MIVAFVDAALGGARWGVVAETPYAANRALVERLRKHTAAFTGWRHADAVLGKTEQQILDYFGIHCERVKLGKVFEI